MTEEEKNKILLAEIKSTRKHKKAQRDYMLRTNKHLTTLIWLSALSFITFLLAVVLVYLKIIIGA